MPPTCPRHGNLNRLPAASFDYLQRYLASMEGALLSGKQCAEQIASSGAGQEPVSGITVEKFLSLEPVRADANARAAVVAAAAEKIRAMIEEKEPVLTKS